MLRRVARRATRGKNSCKNKTQVKTSNPKRLTPEQIQQVIQEKAYEIYCRRGNTSGDHLSDWLAAEKQVVRELRVR